MDKLMVDRFTGQIRTTTYDWPFNGRLNPYLTTYTSITDLQREIKASVPTYRLQTTLSVMYRLKPRGDVLDG